MNICFVDIDECADNSDECHSNAVCSNRNGTYACSCNDGYEGNGFNCTDINECNGENSCHINADCSNRNGTYNCSCNDGYEGDGFNCTGRFIENIL